MWRLLHETMMGDVLGSGLRKNILANTIGGPIFIVLGFCQYSLTTIVLAKNQYIVYLLF